ncbi:PglL family O-oligosaccharyltransferase [Chromobacterium phragmitis]|uniref:Polymerase n=1 Tax=Chromobacterium phragmitis TaxID=2202141 RepID=A0A344UK60_9NEIS|nr:Wzy polymerase domain-containing protein [Chromobacterium phragmitis]AXE35658.1 hypothetical protein DK843_15890 [Chromobacterium phragmitis]
MNNKTAILFFAGLFVIPFLNAARLSPLQDWWTNALVLLTVGGAAVWVFRKRASELEIPWINAFLLVFLLYVIFSGVIHGSYTVTLQMAGVMLSLLLLCQSAQGLKGRHGVLALLAWSLLLGGGAQAAFGLLQVTGLAYHFDGWVVFQSKGPSSSVIGNIGQRNQYANYLTLSMLAACYLWGERRLRGGAAFAALTVFSLLIAWSGARLPLAYGLGLACLAWYWHRRARQNEAVSRMAAAMALSVTMLAFCQVFAHPLVGWLQAVGLDANIQSGADRILDAGLGARRRVEWAKAWLMLKDYPLLGCGLGGYAYQSAWLEAFGGFPKIAENTLFTHSHNLIFQLLAETGVVGSLIILSGLVFCLLPYFYRGAQNSGNLFLIGAAFVILCHSQFEFPLWYLPFLALLALVCALSPRRGFSARLDTALLQWSGVAAGACLMLYVLSGAWVFWTLTQYNHPTADVKTNQERVARLQNIALLPWWQDAANLVLINYVEPSRSYSDAKLLYFEQLARFQPYSAVLFKLAMQQALAGEQEKARVSMAMAIANYPGEVLRFVYFLRAANDPALEGLVRMTQAAARAYALHGVDTEEGRVAAVMAVSAPVTRGPLF